MHVQQTSKGISSILIVTIKQIKGKSTFTKQSGLFLLFLQTFVIYIYYVYICFNDNVLTSMFRSSKHEI